MSLGYAEHSRTRYLRNHYEIYDYRKDRVHETESFEAARKRREIELEARQEERKQALEALIEANRTYTSTSKVTQQIEADLRAKRIEKEKERDRKEKLQKEKEANQKWKSTLEGRKSLRARQQASHDERVTRLERQALYNEVERDRRRQERYARDIAKGGKLKQDDDSSDDDQSKSKSSSSRYVPRSSSGRSTSTVTATSNRASDRLLNKYRDSGSSRSEARSRREASHSEHESTKTSAHERKQSSSSSSSDEE